MNENASLIRVEGITKIFGPNPQSVLELLAQGRSKSEIQAETGHVIGVKDASFEIPAGQVFVIMGLSGSGKSTMIRCVNRLIEPTGGRIFLNDPERGERDVTAMNAEELRQLRRHDMSMVFQHFALFPHRTVLSNTVYGLEVQGRPKEEIEETGRRVLESVGLGDWVEAYPSELSGGMQQRVGLARALATEAKILLMDEPFSALDPLIRVQMQQELKKIQSELHRTILFITHDLDEAMLIGDRIAIMEAGEIVQIGTPEEILVNPQTEYVARFVEQADPTGVITAGTTALPLDSPLIEPAGEADGLSFVARRGNAEIRFGLDSERRLRRVTVEGREAEVRALEEVLEADPEEAAQTRKEELVLTCRASSVVRHLLKGRLYTNRPIVVTEDSGEVVGLVDEPELIRAMLEKRGSVGPAEERSERAAPRLAAG